MDDDKKFSTNTIHSGTYQADGAVNTPVYLSSTYRLNEERYAGWAAGAQHTLLYARISSVNSEAVAKKIATLEGAEDGEIFSSGITFQRRSHCRISRCIWWHLWINGGRSSALWY